LCVDRCLSTVSGADACADLRLLFRGQIYGEDTLPQNLERQRQAVYAHIDKYKEHYHLEENAKD
jgi:hypothetical protein